jgi:type VI secretion system secreted protein VgrG
MPTNERSIRISSWLADGDLLLEHAILREELGKPFEFQLDLLSKRDDIAVGEALWKPITITVDLPGGGSRLFHGLVTRFVAGETRGEYSRYRATLRPWLWLLSRISDCRIFQKMTVPDVIKQVFRDRGFSDFDDRLSETYRTWEYLVQYRESDLNFVSRVMEQEGIYCYFEHDEDKHTLVLADAQSGHDTFAGYETVTYLPPETMAGGVRGDVEHITSWHLARQILTLRRRARLCAARCRRATMRTALSMRSTTTQASSKTQTKRKSPLSSGFKSAAPTSNERTAAAMPGVWPLGACSRWRGTRETTRTRSTW